MIAITDHNRLLLEKINAQVHLYEDKIIFLGELISNIEIYYRLRKTWDVNWDSLFFDKWLDLESIYAGMLSEKRQYLQKDELSIVDNALKAIKNLIIPLLENYTKNLDPTVLKTVTQIDQNWLMCPDCVDAWESSSLDPMVICPKCNQAYHNPRYQK